MNENCPQSSGAMKESLGGMEGCGPASIIRDVLETARETVSSNTRLGAFSINSKLLSAARIDETRG